MRDLLAAAGKPADGAVSVDVVNADEKIVTEDEKDVSNTEEKVADDKIEN